ILASAGLLLVNLNRKERKIDALAQAILISSKVRHAKDVKNILAQIRISAEKNRPLFTFNRSQASDYCDNIEELWSGVDEDTELSANDILDLHDDLFEYGSHCMDLTFAQ
ncbi:MAG: hypothetical protein HY397_03280, partial [Candidatus Doudnabacteria bacterium]|nr:hypothetical protein [Candidatus Doudnabacteria bacterium]